MSTKRNVTARVPDDLFQGLEEVCNSTGLSQTQVIVEALRQYLGTDAAGSIGDRLAYLERELGQLKAKLRLLSS